MTAVLTSTLIALLVIALLVNTRRPPNVNIRVADGDLVVELRAWDAIYCCRRRIQVPLQQVEGVGVYRRALIPAVGLRLPTLRPALGPLDWVPSVA